MPQWTPEEARENAAKGGRAKAAAVRELKALPPTERARRKLEAVTEEMTDELIKAARGQDWAQSLAAKDRLSAILRIHDQTLGKPSTQKPKAEEAKPEEGLQIV